jgi:hypothetical protein
VRGFRISAAFRATFQSVVFKGARMTGDTQQPDDDRIFSGENQIQRQQQQQQKQRQQNRSSSAAPDRELPEKQHQSKHNPVSEASQLGMFNSEQ